MNSSGRGGRQVVPRPARHRPGPEARWTLDGPITCEAVAGVVAGAIARPAPAFDGARLSAVLALLSDTDDGAAVLLTKRSVHLRHHRGEISFPGGRMDPGETPWQTALREASEEVGLDPEPVRDCGQLTHLNTVVSRSYIIPHVAMVDEPLLFEPASVEVEAVWWQPLAELVRADTYHSEIWGEGPTERLLHFFDLEHETIWGATAHMLVDLLDRVLSAREPH